MATLSEVGTLMLEFNALTAHTGNPMFERAAARAMELMFEVKAASRREGCGEGYKANSLTVPFSSPAR